ncbi:MAG TPA: kelch repeat-containing protein [Sediminibacterium sp.]|jgi:N-acetylneuraminic acid mutarotase
MKHIKHFILLPAGIVLVFLSCSKSSSSSSDTSGNWIKRSEFEGNARTEAVSFTIGDTAYIGTGYDGTSRYTDFWAYDPVKNYWMQRAQFPGKARNSAVGFSVGAKGYIATGYDGVNRLADNWEYDPSTNSWTQKADFGGTARYDAVAFGIGDKGYITTGFDGGYTKDIWEFSPSGGTNNSGTWTQRPSLGGSKRSGAVAFVYNNAAYVVTGINNGTTVTDFWKYNPSDMSWTQLRDISNVSSDTYDDDYSDIVRSNAAAFVIGSKAYISVGESASYIKTTWEYDFASDTWVRKTPYERSERTGAVSFTVKGRGFIACGRNSTYYFDDIDEFEPDVTYNANN